MRKIHTLVLFFLLSAMTIMEAQIFVSQFAVAGSNDGTSWANAYLDLADAITNAQAGNEIWVALGEFAPPLTVVPNGTDMDTTHTYYIDKDIKLYGGFTGNETSIDQRSTLFNPVILNGDINDDDIINRFDTLKGDNAHHIFYLTADLTSATVIDGFVIWRGHATSNGMDESASKGGGIYSAGGTPSIVGCTINECFALSGGGIYIEGDGYNSITIDDCVIDRNAGDVGGGLYASELASLSLINTRVTRTKTIDEGAIVIEEINTVDFTDCVIQENEASYYSALYSDAVENFTFNKCLFTNNHAKSAITIQFDDDIQNVTFNQTRVVGNTADSISAGVAHAGGSLNLINSLFGGNESGNPVIFSEVGSQGVVSLNHATIANASSPALLGEYGSINSTNSIIHSDEDGAFAGSATVSSTGGNICSDNSMNSGLTGTGDMTDTDPLLKNIAAGDFLIAFTSPARNAAVNSNQAEDINGDLRDAMPDIGAFESFATATTQTELVGTSISLYPTVAQDQINIKWESEAVTEIEYHVIDQRGAMLKAGLVNNNHQPINISNFAAGQYQIIFTAGNGRTTRSFIKM